MNKNNKVMSIIVKVPECKACGVGSLKYTSCSEEHWENHQNTVMNRRITTVVIKWREGNGTGGRQGGGPGGKPWVPEKLKGRQLVLLGEWNPLKWIFKTDQWFNLKQFWLPSEPRPLRKNQLWFLSGEIHFNSKNSHTSKNHEKLPVEKLTKYTRKEATICKYQ